MRLIKVALIAFVVHTTFFAIGSSTANAEPSVADGLANCTYRVTRTVTVYEKPANASTRLRVKHKGDRVRGFSRLTYYNKVEHVRYRAVDIKKAADDIGWLDIHAVKLIRCDR
ncbi:hypothetical protein [Nonomuraea sp. KM90]|uniref:hypothetical protein n=1 Tax=Nonomuraea sp. KM90 TaxID=3457428 RepID=UPI003FCCE37C